MRVALTGTPGTGKTAVARELRRLCLVVIDLNGLARRRGFLGKYDRARATREVSIRRLGAFLGRQPAEAGPAFYEGHIAHLLDVDHAVVLRCSPPVLRRRR